MMKKMAVALTGGIASGKTVFSNYLHDQYQIPVIDYDLIAKQVIQPKSLGLEQLIQLFGKKILNSKQQLNRTYLRDLIFNNKQLKNKLENLLHPLIRKEADQYFQYYLENDPSPYCLMVIPLLGKTDHIPCFLKHILVVHSSYQKQVERLNCRKEISPKTAQKMLDQQTFDRKRLKKLSSIPSTLIANQSTIEKLHQQADKVHQVILSGNIQSFFKI